MGTRQKFTDFNQIATYFVCEVGDGVKANTVSLAPPQNDPVLHRKVQETRIPESIEGDTQDALCGPWFGLSHVKR